MANKKISELQLIDDATSDLMLPSDDGIQTYRVTAAQLKDFILANENILLAMLKNDIFSGLTAVTPTTADQIPLVDADDSSNTKKATLANILALATSGRLYRAPQVFTASDTYTKVSTVNYVIAIVVGAGGGGGSAATTGAGESSEGGGGGGGGVSIKLILNSSIGSTESVTVGSGGAGGAAGADNAGSAGGSSSFGSHCSATGGGGGDGDDDNTTYDVASGGAGGVGSGGDINLNGGIGARGQVNTGNPSNHNSGGNSAIFGCRAVFTTGSSGAGVDGQNFGDGGSGGRTRTSSAVKGGDGKDGAVILLEVI